MIIRLENIAQYVGQTVTIQGWLYDKTDKGKLQFLQVRDGTGIAQAVDSLSHRRCQPICSRIMSVWDAAQDAGAHHAALGCAYPGRYRLFDHGRSG
jgi:aspartyl/asparaginyl-tRNA synthetase